MLWIAICEDDAKYLAELEKVVALAAKQHDRVTSYSNGLDFLHAVDKSPYPPDILLLDMELPGIDGMSTALGLRTSCPDTYIIIITTHEKYLLGGYDLRNVYYFMKPAPPDKLKDEINRIRLIVEAAQSYTIRICTRESLIFLHTREIIYIQSSNQGVTIYTASDDYDFVKKLTKISEELLVHGFFQISRSCTINTRFIKELHKKELYVVMPDGNKFSSFSVSKRRMPLLIDYIAKQRGKE
jgi:DNA-binding LytR/AlgR family response regulator